MANNAKLPNIDGLIQAGIDPKTGLPIKIVDGPANLKGNIKMAMRIVDEQDAVNRYRWEGLPPDLSSQELERLIYYRGQLAFFYLEELNKFFILPYALDGTIDAYGRYKTIHPVPISSGSQDTKIKQQEKTLAEYLATKSFDVLYEPVTIEALKKNPDYYMTQCCVLLHDYTKQIGQNIIPRVQVQESLIDIMSNIIPYLNTSLINTSGVSGIRVRSAGESQNVTLAARSMKESALNGETFVPILGDLDFQDLSSASNKSNPQDFLMSLQALDNFRLSLYGLNAGGVFEKKAHVLESEEANNKAINSLVLRDGLQIRQRAATIINSVWMTGTWCECSEEAYGGDTNGDGMVSDTGSAMIENTNTGEGGNDE